jgi:hypothetical protein
MGLKPQFYERPQPFDARVKAAFYIMVFPVVTGAPHRAMMRTTPTQ